MEPLYSNFNCNTSKLFSNSFNAFSNGYKDAADLIVTTVFAKLGLYDIVKHTANEEDVMHYVDVRFNLRSSYIWSELSVISDMLRYSYLYTITHKSLSYLLLASDKSLNKTVLSFKDELIEYIRKHSMFLAYCDLEKSGLFLYINPRQSLPKELFLVPYNEALEDINRIYNRYNGKLSKVVLSSIHQIRSIIDVREIYGETLIILPHKSILSKCLPSFNKNTFNDIMFNFERCDLSTLHLYLEALYSNLSLLHVIDSLDWLLSMQGRTNCINCHKSVQEFITIERLEYLKFIENTILSHDSGIMKQELTKLNFLRKAFKTLHNEHLLRYYSLDSLGYNSLFIIGNATRLYNNNIKMIAYADILFMGFYDVIESSHLPSHEHIGKIIESAERDLKEFQTHTHTDFMTSNLSIKTTYSFCQSLKKVRRFYRWLQHVQCDDVHEQTQGLDLIFGTVNDSDGQPTICPICLDSSIDRKDTWWKLHPCFHTIHLDCYNELCKTKHCVCPMCRVKIT